MLDGHRRRERVTDERLALVAARILQGWGVKVTAVDFLPPEVGIVSTTTHEPEDVLEAAFRRQRELGLNRG